MSKQQTIKETNNKLIKLSEKEILNLLKDKFYYFENPKKIYKIHDKPNTTLKSDNDIDEFNRVEV